MAAAPLRILQFGATGQLARAMIERAPRANVSIAALSRADADLSVPGAAARAVERAEADLVLIAAGYTAVDQAESDANTARRVNAQAPGEIAAACAARGLPLIHISTDYVFSGGGARPWRETDAPAPINVYGATKEAGERAVLESGARALVLRTSWVMSPWGRNFVTTMLRLARERAELSVVADQHGRPTSALDLADAILAMAPRFLDGGAAGVFHFANDGATTWAEFARAIFAEAAARGLPAARVKDIATTDYPTPARRPANSVLSTAHIQSEYGVVPRPWREALSEVMDAISAGAASPGA